MNCYLRWFFFFFVFCKKKKDTRVLVRYAVIYNTFSLFPLNLKEREKETQVWWRPADSGEAEPLWKTNKLHLQWELSVERSSRLVVLNLVAALLKKHTGAVHTARGDFFRFGDEMGLLTETTLSHWKSLVVTQHVAAAAASHCSVTLASSCVTSHSPSGPWTAEAALTPPPLGVEATCMRLRSLQTNADFLQFVFSRRIRIVFFAKPGTCRCRRHLRTPRWEFAFFPFLAWIIQVDLEAEFARSFKKASLQIRFKQAAFHQRLIISSTNPPRSSRVQVEKHPSVAGIRSFVP